MARKNFADVTLLIDRSGSMSVIRQATVDGINSFINEQKAIPGDGCWSLYQFDSPGMHNVGRTIFMPEEQFPERIYSAMPQSQVEAIPLSKFVPRGNTALIDATCITIDQTGARIAAMPESDRPSNVVMVIVTDGMENASIRYTQEQLRQRITHQKEKYNWTFIYLGANQDAIAEGAKYGIEEKTCAGFVATTAGTTASYQHVNSCFRNWKMDGMKNEGLIVNPEVPDGVTVPGVEVSISVGSTSTATCSK